MTPEEAFLDDIAENPADDAPRLVCADWLDDHGRHDRAEFIRVQCELARLGRHEWVRRYQLERREHELWAAHEKEWSAPLRPYSRSFVFERGFPAQVTLRARTFLDHHGQIRRVAPLWNVRLRDCNDHVAELARCPDLGRLRRLNLEFNKLGDERLRTLLASPHLKNLTSLDLSNNSLSSDAGEVLAGAALDSLRELILDTNDLGERGVAALAKAPWRGRLHTLGLGNTDVTPAALRALLAPDGMAGLRHLDLSRNGRLGDAGMETLAGSPGAQNLTTLVLQHVQPLLHTYALNENGLGEPGLRALACSPNLARLSHLDLSENWSVGYCLGGLSGAPAPLPSLTSLNLTYCLAPVAQVGPQDPAAFAAFICSPFVRGLVSLDLSINTLVHSAVRALASSPALARLSELRLSGRTLTPETVKVLAKRLSLPALAHLDLSDCGLGDGALMDLAGAAGLARLRTLDLSRNTIKTSAGVAALLRSPYLEKLAALDLRRGTCVPTKEADRVLRQRFGERVLL